MGKSNLFIAKSEIINKTPKISGKYIERDGEKFYKIENFNAMPPFFMSIVSDSNHWMFISSNGALSAGRQDSESALFPYYTDDKITDSPDITGSKTIIAVKGKKKTSIWEPFSDRNLNLYNITRNIYKNIYGNKLIIEEINNDLGVAFEYAWLNSDKYGFIKRSSVINLGKKDVKVNVLDGIQNILPYGVDSGLQNEYSTLADAYKKNELIKKSNIGIYYLSSIPSDKAEPSEGLKATTVWSVGVDADNILLSSNQLDEFRKGNDVCQEEDVRAARGAYFINTSLKLKKGAGSTWYTVSEVNQDSTEVIRLSNMLKNDTDIIEKLEEDIKKGTKNLVKIVGNADGLQSTDDDLTSSRHFANVLFNVMRGGIFDNNYTIEKADFVQCIENYNKPAVEAQKAFIDGLPEVFNYSELLEKAKELGDNEMMRLCYEYMPLTFSRRHGDPSRPWNKFSIKTKNSDGSKLLSYQGNWRDIFQNWEALSMSFPEYIESMISKFLNASTADGYNPYRITREGIDWEAIDPNDPWSNIGYWGDHQIIYLLKLLEVSNKYHNDKLNGLFSSDIFAYANVPYRIKEYKELLKDPQNTIDFDDALEDKIEKLAAKIGADGKLIQAKKGGVYKVNLAEKLLVTVLSKFTNFIPEAGIWLNTQRPEWNDANNALVGYGVSMVTLYYMRRYQAYMKKLFNESGMKKFEMSTEVAELLKAISTAFTENKGLLANSISDTNRKKILDLVGTAGTEYRNKVYKGFSEKKAKVTLDELNEFIDVSLEFIDHSIKANKREDGLYHAYNLMKVEGKTKVGIRYLYEMLEGQVALLSSGVLSADEAVEVIEALRKSKLYREDQYSYILYPDRQLPKFMEKNNIPTEKAGKSALLTKLLEDENKAIVQRDIKGGIHFNGKFRNASDLKEALEQLSGDDYKDLVKKDKKLILDLFEEVFDHQSFTGRSGTFYGYEGLGCIYWHMVSKLVLAIEENYYWAKEKGDAGDKTLSKLVEHYFSTRAGIGLNKPPELYGAFPTDPYSHTPGNAGAQQPGMTGQVKEDVISRWGELGVVVNNGIISFNPILLRRSEFVKKSKKFECYDVKGKAVKINLDKASLGFTYCQVPIVYHMSSDNKIEVSFTKNKTEKIDGLSLTRELSDSIFKKDNFVARIDVYLEPSLD